MINNFILKKKHIVKKRWIIKLKVSQVNDLLQYSHEVKSSINDDIVSSTNTRSKGKINERSLPSWWEENRILRKIDSTDYNTEWVRDAWFGIYYAAMIYHLNIKWSIGLYKENNHMN